MDGWIPHFPRPCHFPTSFPTVESCWARGCAGAECCEEQAALPHHQRPCERLLGHWTEHGPVKIVRFLMKHDDFPEVFVYVYQRVLKYHLISVDFEVKCVSRVFHKCRVSCARRGMEGVGWLDSLVGVGWLYFNLNASVWHYFPVCSRGRARISDDTPLVRGILKDFDGSNMKREDPNIDAIYQGRIGRSRRCPFRRRSGTSMSCWKLVGRRHSTHKLHLGTS